MSVRRGTSSYPDTRPMTRTAPPMSRPSQYATVTARRGARTRMSRIAAMIPSGSWARMVMSDHDGNAVEVCTASAFQSEKASSTANPLQKNHEMRRRPRVRIPASAVAPDANRPIATSATLCSPSSNALPPIPSIEAASSTTTTAASGAVMERYSRRRDTLRLAPASRLEPCTGDGHASKSPSIDTTVSPDLVLQ